MRRNENIVMAVSHCGKVSSPLMAAPPQASHTKSNIKIQWPFKDLPGQFHPHSPNKDQGKLLALIRFSRKGAVTFPVYSTADSTTGSINKRDKAADKIGDNWFSQTGDVTSAATEVRETVKKWNDNHTELFSNFCLKCYFADEKWPTKCFCL